MSTRSIFLTAFTALALTSTSAYAGGPYVTLTDDGTIEGNAFTTLADQDKVQAKLLALYAASGAPLPDVLSVWSTFNLGPDYVGTIFDPLGADVKGIGLASYYPPDGLLTSPKPPLEAILFHNNVLQLPARAQVQSAPLDGFADYLFLLELSHRFGPEIQVPSPNADELVGFDFHWSFWMDAGGSPSGGNVWKDNGDGTFTVVAADPKTLKYSMVDLYLMGLAAPTEVPPFGVLENVTPPATPTDPLWGGVYAGHSFPWFAAATPYTVTATRRTVTIDDVVSANGVRDPAAGAAPKSWTLGIVLLVSKNDDAAAVAAAQQGFDPIASSFAPAFATATQGRGTLDVVTQGTSGTGGSGGAGGSSSSSAASSSNSAASGSGGAGGAGGTGGKASGGCGYAGQGSSGADGMSLLIAIGALAMARRRRAG